MEISMSKWLSSRKFTSSVPRPISRQKKQGMQVRARRGLSTINSGLSTLRSSCICRQEGIRVKGATRMGTWASLGRLNKARLVIDMHLLMCLSSILTEVCSRVGIKMNISCSISFPSKAKVWVPNISNLHKLHKLNSISLPTDLHSTKNLLRDPIELDISLTRRISVRSFKLPTYNYKLTLTQ